MNEALDVAYFKKTLEAKLAELERRAADVKRDLQKPLSQDFAEQATEAENNEVLEGILAEASLEIQQVKKALLQIEEGTYGDCVECGKQINPERLKALPFSQTCINCAD